MLGLWLELDLQVTPAGLPRLSSYFWSQETLLTKPPKCWDDKCVPPCQLVVFRCDERLGSVVLVTSNSGDTNVLSILSSWTYIPCSSHEHCEISALVACSHLKPVCRYLTVGVSMKFVSP